jgi:NAD(P)-dependent dehydrogenase (short-subunit alcohol dehydrogenase family)
MFLEENIFSLKSKVIIVTGGARGNGLAIGKSLLDFGATTYFFDRLKSELKNIEQQIQSDKAHFVNIDVTDYAKFANCCGEIFLKENRIDVLVNNAGVTYGQNSEKYSQKNWDETFRVNLEAPFRLSQIIFPYMKKTGAGSIINITSIASELGMSKNPAYVSSKGGLKQLTKALAKDWAAHGIRVNNLGLGYFQTDMTQKSFNDESMRNKRSERIMLGRWGKSRDLAGPAVFLASDASRYMTGQDLYIDGGLLTNGI